MSKKQTPIVTLVKRKELKCQILKMKVKQLLESAFEILQLVYLVLSMIGSMSVCVYIQFSNIDSTEMRLFVDYWWVYLIIVVAMIPNYFIIESARY